MSLLMEALRKAEEAKRRMQQEEQAAAGKDSRETVNPFPASNSLQNSGSAFTLEEREPEVTPEYIRDNFTSRSNAGATAETPDEYTAPDDHAVAPEPDYVRKPASAPTTPAVVRRQQRAAAASVFMAKQHPARNRKALTILVLAMVLIIPAGGAVLWYLQSASMSSIGIQPGLANYDLSSREFVDETPASAAVAETTSTAAEPNALAETPPSTTAATATDAAQEPVTTEAASESVLAELPEENVTTSSDTPTPAPQIAATQGAVPPIPVDAPVQGELAQPNTAGASVMEISRTRSAGEVNPDLVVAYESLQSGDLATARRLYQQLLDVLPNNRDALLGLASINLREGDPAGARTLYARLLQLNPRDPLAHTGLLQTMQASDPAEHERTLKSLISSYPDVAQLTLALGNHYASQQRWSEAQGAYYNALLIASRGTGGPVHPDYAFNLAVSFEQLNEPRAALDYYRRAQALATEVTPGFDRQLLNSRLAYLEQVQP